MIAEEDDDQANLQADMDLMRSVRPDNLSFLPSDNLVLAATTSNDGEEEALVTNLGSNHFDSAELYRREHLAATNSDQHKLLDFEKELGIRDIVVRIFDGSYAMFVQYASVNLTHASLPWELKLREAFFAFYEAGNVMLESIHPDIRSRIMLVGDGEQPNLIGMIHTLYQEAMISTGGVAEDGMELEIEDAVDDTAMRNVNQKVWNLLENRNGGYSTNGRTHLQRLSGQTMNKYRSTGFAFLLFYARQLEVNADKQDESCNTKWWHTHGRQALEMFDADAPTSLGSQSAQMVVLKLLAMSLELSLDRRVELEATTKTVLLFVVCKAIDLPTQVLENLIEVQQEENTLVASDGSVIFRSVSPQRAHSVIAALTNVFRVGFIAGMVHSAKAGNQDWKNLFWSPTVLCFSPIMRDLAYRAKVCRKYESQLQMGTPRAFPKVPEENAGVSAWEIPNAASPVLGTVLTIGLTQIGTAISRLVLDAEQAVKDLVLELTNANQLDQRAGIFLRHKLPMNQPDFVAKLLTAMFGRQVQLIPDGSKLKFSPEVTLQVLSGGSGSKRQRVDAYAATIGAKFHMENGLGQVETVIESDEIAAVLAEVCGRDDETDFRKQFDAVCELLLDTIVALFKCTLRGQPRTPDINGMKIGVSNIFETSTQSDVIAVPSVGATMTAGGDSFYDRLGCNFPSTKFAGGDNQRQLKEYINLCEMLSRLFGIYLAVFRTAQVKYLQKCDLSKVNFGKQARESQSSPDFCQSLLVPVMTKLTMEIRISSKVVVARPAHNWEKRVQALSEKALGIPAGSLPDRQYRMLWASVTACKMRRNIITSRSVDAFGGFNHSLSTHLFRYLNTERQGAQNSAGEHVEEAYARDTLFSLEIGAAGYDFNPSKLSANLECLPFNPYQAPTTSHGLRLFSASEALGLYRFGGKIDFVAREFEQTAIATEIVSGNRDAQCTIQCGGGKTIAVWTLVAYNMAKHIARWSDEDRIEALKGLLAEKDSSDPPRNNEENELLATAILDDPHVSDMLEFVSSDKNHCRSGICIVIVPTTALRKSMVDSLNDLYLVRAVAWTKSSSENVEGQLQTMVTGNGPALSFDVLVATCAFATKSQNCTMISQLCKKDKVTHLVVDESHLTVLDRNWRSDVRKLSLILRYQAPVIGLSGTMQKSMEPLLRLFLSFSLGQESVFNDLLAKYNPHAPSLSNQEINDRVSMWKKSKGFIRSALTVPSHIGHFKIKLDDGVSDLEHELFRAVARFCKSQNFRSVQIIVPRRKDVDPLAKWMRREFPDHKIIAMKSGDLDETDIQSWQDPTQTCHAVSTTIGAVGLNNPNCDCVIHLLTFFGIQMLIQAALRAGRRMQPSKSIFFHSESVFGRMQQLEEQDEFREQALRDSGINMDEPSFVEHFSVSSMESFLNCQTCLFENLVETMDGYRPNQGGCSNCSACNTQMQQSLSTAWSLAVNEIADEGPIDDDNNISDDQNQLALEEAASRQQVVDEILQRRQLLVQWVQSLRGGRCLWHSNYDVQHSGCSQLFRRQDDFESCMEPLYTLLGHRLSTDRPHDRRRICCACGDKMVNVSGNFRCVSSVGGNPCSYCYF